MSSIFERPGANGSGLAGQDQFITSLYRPRSAECGAGGTCASPAPLKRSKAPNLAPADLLDFVRTRSLSQAVQLLKLSRPQVCRLRQGYWPRSPDRTLAAWAAYKARNTGARQTSYFLRRVQAGGVMMHRGQLYAHAGLQKRVGQLLAVARVPGGLLAVALDLPAERFVLEAAQ